MSGDKVFLWCHLTSMGVSNFRPKHWTKQVALPRNNFRQLKFITNQPYYCVLLVSFFNSYNLITSLVIEAVG